GRNHLGPKRSYRTSLPRRSVIPPKARRHWTPTSRRARNPDKRRVGSRRSSRSVRRGAQRRALGVNHTISFPS
ncbi:hypothetical protein JG687_00017427, partial [Phytophthora cactorum]